MNSCSMRSLALFFVLAAVGCGGGRGDVTGKISYKGKPVIYGSVLFVGRDGVPVKGNIEPGGTYTVKQVATGENQIGVNSPDPRDVNRTTSRKKEKRELPVNVEQWLAIPRQFTDPRKSGLSFNVQPGPNTYDIELK